MQFKYATTAGGISSPFEAPDAKTAISMLSGFKDVAPGSGVMAVQAPTPSLPTPTPTAVNNSDGSVSSADVVTKKNATTAVNQAGTSLTMPDIPQMIQSYNDASNAQLNLSQSALKKTYDASLGSQNPHYNQLFQELEQNYKNASQAAAALAAQINPYSDPRISSATAGYQQAIDQKYQAQAQVLQAQMDAAQKNLDANYYQNYVSLVNDAQQKQAEFQQSMLQYGLQLYNAAKQEQQFNQSFGLQEKQYDLSKETKATDDFRSYLTTLSGSPELQKDIAAYQQNGQISPGLMPIVEKGIQAGMSASEALSIFQYQTDSVRKQQELENYRANQLALSSQRVAIAQANYYNKLSSQIPAPGQIVTSSGNIPVKLSDAQSQFFSLGQHLDTQAQKVKQLLAQLPTNAVKGWVTEGGKFVPIVQNKNDPKQYELLQAMSDLNNTFVYFSTGKQLNETEFERLANQLPNTKATPEYNNSALDNFTASIQQRMNSYMSVNGWKIYGGAETATPASNPATPSPLKSGTTSSGIGWTIEQ